MGRFGRAWRWVKELVTGPPEPPEPPPPPPEPPSPPPPPIEPPGQDLPKGWKFEGLYYGDRIPSERRVINQDPSDSEIATATDVIVSYTDALGIVYRTVHGANSRKDVGKLIARTIAIVSPPR